MTASQTNSAGVTAVGQEQAYLDMLYRLLDEARDRTERALARTHGSGGAGGTFQARIEREVTASEQARRLAQLNAVEHGLCFGRIDSGGHGPTAAGGKASRVVPPGPSTAGPRQPAGLRRPGRLPGPDRRPDRVRPVRAP